MASADENNNTGIAGRTDYATWNKIASELTEQVEREESKETELEKAKLGLDGKYAHSKAEADEREKAKKIAATKKALETYKQRENAAVQEMKGIFENNDNNIVRITRDAMQAGKRVLSISETTGKSVKEDTIVITQDLSHLESKMTSDNNKNTTVFGLIKVFLSNVHNCTILIKSKIISGTVEISRCSNVRIRIEKEATVATIQADLCRDIILEFRDAASGKNNHNSPLFWGDDANDRVFHAGVENMTIRVLRDDVVESECTCHYLEDGAEAVGNATPQEYQFVTSVVDGSLATERVIRTGSSTGKNARAMTQRELDEEKATREKAAAMALDRAQEMIQIQTKEGKPVQVTKTEEKEQVEEEVYTAMDKQQIDSIVEECEQNKARGNEAFGAGEYAQAVLLYTLALDKADELPDDKHKQLFPRHVALTNRAACFLKLGQHEKACKDAEKAHTEYDPNYVKAWFRHGLALHAMGQYSEALPILGKAQQLEPQNKQIKQALQFAEVRMTQEMRKRQEEQ